MRKLIEHKETLIYYDSPQLFLADDQFDTQYLCLLVECTDEFDRFLCVPISSEQLKGFYRGQVDLRKIYEMSEDDELFWAEIGDQVSIRLIPLSYNELSKGWLPEPHFFFSRETS